MDLEKFHPNITHFLTDLEEAHPSKVKGLVKMHKAARPDGKHGIRLLLASCGTPTAPASKFLQQAIAHIFPLLLMKDTKAVLQKIKCINDNHPDGLPESTINVGCDVKNMFGSIDQEHGMQALKHWLELHPNPDNLPTALLLDLARICLQENCAEFLGRFFNPNTGTATGPAHACDFCDIAMAPLDEEMEQQLELAGVEHEGWTIFRDDGWLVLLNGMQDVQVVEETLAGLHPSIQWEVNPRGPTAPPVVGADGVVVDTTRLEHLDLTIHLVDGKLETDLFAKDVPNYVSRRSCHPPATFSSMAKAVLAGAEGAHHPVPDLHHTLHNILHHLSMW